MNSEHYNKIRSFILREGRMTKAQQKAIDELMPIYGLFLENGVFDFVKIFSRSAVTILEIGFGMGSSLVEMAEKNPEKNFIGIEMHRPGIGVILQHIHEKKLNNIRIMRNDAVEVLNKCIADESLDCVQIFFPDPWPKRKHHKRRLIQKEFVCLVLKKLKLGGFLHIATDWEDYAYHILKVVESIVGFTNIAGKHKFSPRPEWRPLTKFEERGTKLQHGVWDIILKKSVDRG